MTEPMPNTREALEKLYEWRELYREDWWRTYRVHDWKEHRAINNGWCEIERQLAALEAEGAGERE